MKTTGWKTGLLVGILSVMVALISAPVQAEEDRVINVTGDAEVRVVPDEVVITLGVETDDMEIDVAKAKNDERVQRVLALTEDYEIKPQHVQTEYIDIEPRYDYDEVFLGYFVRKTILVTLKDISTFEDFLTDSLKAGVNYVHGIEFRTTELRKYRDQARDLAIQAAREKAEALAGALDQSVGLPRTITENRNWWWSSYGSWWGSRRGGSMAQNVIQNVGEPAAASDGAFAPGQVVVQASITVSFELESQ